MQFPPTITEAAAAIRAGKLTSVALVQQCLARIDRYDDKIHAWVLVDREGALNAAMQADRQFASGHEPGPLLGIPIGVKDIMHVAGMPTRCGSPISSMQPSKYSAAVVTRLRDAGAIILGKTVTCEWACFDPPSTRNPWNRERTPGGSSSGSAAAVAAGMCLGAIGTQTGGSIIRPAAFCGVVGFKPTFGLISTEGVFPFSQTLDHVGVLTRTVADAGLLIHAICGDLGPPENDPRPTTGGMARFRLVDSATGFVQRTTAPHVALVVQGTVEALREAGAVIDSHPMSIRFEDAILDHRTIMAHAAAAVHQPFFSSAEDRYGPEIRRLLREGQRVSAGDRRRADAGRCECTRLVEQSTDDGSILIMPSVNTTAPELTTTGDSRFQAIWSMAGLPAITIPCGLTPDRMPVGMQLIGRRNGERELCRAAAWCEGVIRWNDQPSLE